MQNTQHGFTMVELIVVITIVGILMAIGAPSYKYVTTANRVSSEVNGLIGDLQFARAESIKQGLTVSVCSSTDGATCSGSSTWTNGWIVFTDVGTIGTVDPASDVVLRVQGKLPSNDTLAADNSINTVTFNREGFARNLPGTVNIKLHDSTSNSGYTRCVSITVVGALSTLRSGVGGCS
jgi:type IV fimbrial biogenesis protein FimT